MAEVFATGRSESLVAIEDIPYDLVRAPREFVVDRVYLGPVHLTLDSTQLGENVAYQYCSDKCSQFLMQVRIHLGISDICVE